MSSWKQLAASKYESPGELNEIIRYRQENIKFKMDIENLRAKLNGMEEKAVHLQQHIDSLNSQDNKLKEKMAGIVLMLGSDATHANLMEESSDNLIERIQRQTKKRANLNRSLEELERLSNERKEMQVKHERLEKDIHNKDAIIRQFQSQLAKLNAKIREKDVEIEQQANLLSDYSRKLSHAEKEKQAADEELASVRAKGGEGESARVKSECMELLSKIPYRQDDYLRSYLKKHNLLKNGSEQVSKRNKYDFIFDS